VPGWLGDGDRLGDGDGDRLGDGDGLGPGPPSPAPVSVILVPWSGQGMFWWITKVAYRGPAAVGWKPICTSQV
jgi:hypothetical protein